MAEIKVTYSKLKETSDTIASASNEFMGIMSEIKSTMDSLRGGNKWESEGADRFHDQFSKLNASFEAYERTLNKYCQFLEHTAEEYAKVDNKVVDESSVLDASSLFA